MAHIGFFALYASGHLNPALSLGRALHDRGHKVTFFNILDVRDEVLHAGLNFIPFGESTYPRGSAPEMMKVTSTLQGAAGLQNFIQRMLTLADLSFKELPQIVRQQNLDALVIDQFYPGGATIAHYLKLPYALLANVVFSHPDSSVPPPSFPMNHDPSDQGRARNQMAWEKIYQAFTPWQNADNAYRERWDLPQYEHILQDSLSPLAQITTMPSDFDLPRQNAPASLHHVGPFVSSAALKAVPFPWERLNGKPLVYGSLGTLHTGIGWIYRTIMDACSTLDCQLVLSLGNSHLEAASLGEIPDNVILVSYAPQNELLARAALCITHAGMNTTLDALTFGVPLVALPIGSDNQGVAARIQYTETGEVIQLDQLNAESLRNAASKVLEDPRYKANAQRLQHSIAQLEPLVRACEIIEAQVLVSELDSVSRSQEV
ncbi:nucleotide disphospho-sugar-binding domain-containing protein [Granulicella sp. dw_53]|uniref:glycosyltransferase n=1 Tax=Granulicella sp. dw_53 TaxID=2719792 RepID=UPI001BD65A67|nr:nucleotide disphospho-sugar-binding domain-containing protein [Granulicella sp. dw_53]